MQLQLEIFYAIATLNKVCLSHFVSSIRHKCTQSLQEKTFYYEKVLT